MSQLTYDDPAPGKDASMKYHVLYRDGRQWTMLGPVWRVLKQ